MIDPRFAILGALITLAGSASYARDTLRGKTQPNRVSWVMWTVAPLIAFAAEVSQGVGLDALLTFAVGFGPLLVVIASVLDPQAYNRLTRLDVFCGVMSVAALVGWALTGRGNVAICLSILSDLLGAVPTLRKAYTHPGSESAGVFVGGAVGSTITLLAIRPDAWGFANFAFPLYILAIDLVLSSLILVPRLRRTSLS
jgi:hypothetical protein